MPYTLLLADDSVTIQRVIELTFADEDVIVVAVSDGDQAIERLEASPPDIVLADIGMPGKNGYEVAQYIRRSPKLSHIPVVLLTGAFEPVDQARANDAGCNGVLAKPFEPQLVIGRVKELLARSHRGHEAHDPAQNPAVAGEGDLSVPPRPPLVPPDADSNWAPPAEAHPVTPFLDAPGAETPTVPVPHSKLNDYFDRLDAAFSKLSPTAPAPSAPPVEVIAHTPATAPENALDWFGTTVTEGGSTEPWDLPAPPADVAPEDLPLTHASPQPETPFALPQPQESLTAVTEVEPVPDAVLIVEAAPIVESAQFAEAAPIVEAASIAAPDEHLAPIEESAPIEPEAAPAAPAEPPVAVASIPADASLATPAAVAPLVPAAPALELPLPNPLPLPSLADAFAALLAAEQGEPSPAGALWAAQPPPAAVSDEMIETITRRVLDRLSDTVVREAVSDIASTIAERLIREEIERIKAAIK